MEDAAHVALQRLVDHLVLLDAALAAEALRDDLGGIMVAVAGQIACPGATSCSRALSSTRKARSRLPPALA